MAEPLTVGEVRDLVPRISYKPGWTFEFRYPSGVVQNVCAIEIMARVSDSRTDQLGATSTIGTMCHLHDTDLWRGQEAVLDLLRDHIDILERHERDEWLAIDGEVCRSPHVEERTKVVRVRNSVAPRPPVYADAFTMSMVSH